MDSLSATSALTSNPASPTGSCSASNYNQIPTQDIACAYYHPNGLSDSIASSMKQCCKSAPVEQFASDCALYCLSIDQTVGDLTKCFQDVTMGNPSLIFCNGNMTATATAKAGDQPDSTADPTASSTANPEKGAAGTLKPIQGVSKAGLGMLGMVFLSAFVGGLM